MILKNVHPCLHCKTLTKNPKFCSRSCASSINNHTSPKKSKTRKCRKCKAPVCSRISFCQACRKPPIDYSSITIQHWQGKAKYQVSAQIRTHARKTYKSSGRPMVCQCGYSKHVEICHKQPINSFPPNTPICIVNSTDNLIALCPNCHWELDHGFPGDLNTHGPSQSYLSSNHPDHPAVC